MAPSTGDMASRVVDDRGRPADWSELTYFVNTTISSLGYGDFTPARYPWTLITTVATFSATVLLTVSLSYVLSVLAASIERRALAQGVFEIGGNLRQWIREIAWGDRANLALEIRLLNLAAQISLHAHKHQAYPILIFFHAPQPGLSLPRAVLLLADVTFVLRLASPDRRPPEHVRRLMASAADEFARCTAARQRATVTAPC